MTVMKNEELTLNKHEFDRIEDVPALLENRFGHRLLRWYLWDVKEDELSIEMTVLSKEEEDSFLRPLSEVYPGKSIVVSIIPTGIGCEIGGFAADAAPATALLASCCDYLVTNPNAVNASDFILLPDNVLYTEGYIIDQFSKGLVNLYQPYANKVGLIIDKPKDQSQIEIIFNIINTVRAVYGVDIEDYIITERSMGGKCQRYRSGSYVGQINHPEVLFNACKDLLKRGVNALAVTSNITDLPLDNYAAHFQGQHPNPVGGAEAVISHIICKKYGVPAAHAPLMNVKNLELESRIVDARGAGEFSSASGLACVLIGLSRAPQLIKTNCRPIKEAVNLNNLLAVVAPASALGGIPVIYAEKFKIPIIAVKDNRTILDVTAKKLNLKQVIPVNNYPEAAGILQALRKGISIPSLLRPLSTLRSP